MTVDRLGPLDDGFLLLERDIQQMHVGSILVFEGPAPEYETILASMASRLHLVPRYRQRVRRVPLDIARPVWVDDEHFNLTYHVRHTALPSPGGEAQLQALGGRLMSQRLDTSRPLWEMWFVEGLADGRWAIINKVHHAMIDGISGHDLLEVLLDAEPSEGPWPAPKVWVPQPTPSTYDLLVDATRSNLGQPVDVVKRVGSVFSGTQAMTMAAGRAVGVARAGEKVARPESVLNGSIGPHRRWSWARATLDDVKLVKNTFGGTVNDVVLAAISGGFRTFLTHRGESVQGMTLRTMVPVSVRRPDQRGTLGNQVSAKFADLPVGVADPVDRLHAVTRQLKGLKKGGMALGVEALIGSTEFAPAMLVALGSRVAARVPQRQISTVTTNVPGPQAPLFMVGRQLVEMIPYIPLAIDLRITIGIFSYCGALTLGVTADYDEVPDIDVLCSGLESAFAELVAAATEADDS
jgi:WS/DGAT/MGAT family acyltransferase